jgi:hypothetical protein
MDNPALRYGLDCVLPFRRLEPHGKSAAKSFCSIYPRNPLISLDSDERIQGNPRKSNPQDRGFSQRNGRSPRQSKQIVRAGYGAADGVGGR